MSLYVRCRENVFSGDVFFDGFCFKEGRIAGFHIVLLDYTTTFKSEYVVLLIEVSEHRELLGCYDFLNSIIMKHAEPIEGPLTVDRPFSFRHYLRAFSFGWSRAIAALYSIILRVFTEEIRKSLVEGNPEQLISKDIYREFLNDLGKVCSQRAVSDVVDMVNQLTLLKDRREMNEEDLLRMLSVIIKGIHRLREYIDEKGKYRDVVYKAYRKLIILDDRIREKSRQLAQELRKICEKH